jgi:ammonia channel protein AmtB
VFERYRIDDPVEAVQIHGVCGFLGILNVGIFGNKNGLITTSENSFK